jgi:hypothetical protein
VGVISSADRKGPYPFSDSSDDIAMEGVRIRVDGLGDFKRMIAAFKCDQGGRPP